MTSCGTTGTATCAGGTLGPCAPPAETCNLQDDDCNGVCDDLLGCRIAVDRSSSSSSGLHFYTTNDAEAECCGMHIEQFGSFYLWPTAHTGLVPFYRCLAGAGHLYTTDPNCEGTMLEGTMGYIATQPVCGAVPLYRLVSGADHLYTTSAAESAAAQGMGYTLEGTVGYVWPGPCEGGSCTWPSPIQVNASALTTVTGFPTAWYGFPVPPGGKTLETLTGQLAIQNAQNLYSEVLFIVSYLPSGACTIGRWPATTPEFGPPGSIGLAQFIVKNPNAGAVNLPLGFTLPGGLPFSGCLMVGLNGGPVSMTQDVISVANLSLSYAGPSTPAQSIIGMGGEFCFGQNWGCQAATTDNTKSFAYVSPTITSPLKLVAMYGSISDSTFDGTSGFGPLPSGAWTALNDFFIYHGAECAAVGPGGNTTGPGNFYSAIPADAVPLMSVPITGNGRGVSNVPIFKPLTGVTLQPGDCLVTLWGLQSDGAFDNETQVIGLVSP
jgi:hypothetical protein